MAAKFFLFTVIVLSSFILSSSNNVEDNRKSRVFIRRHCNSVATHKYLCYNSLSPYAPTVQQNPIALARTAVNVTLERIRSLPARISKLAIGSTGTEKQLLNDCHGYLNDALRIQPIVTYQMRGLEELAVQERTTRVSMARKLLAAALAVERRCLDGVNGGGDGVRGEVKAEVNRLVGESTRYMDNAVDLVAALAPRS